MDRKEAIRQYKETATPMGVFRVRNTKTGKSFIGTSVNLPAMLNRQRFQLANGAHRSKELQADVKALGIDTFAFETLDVLEPLKEPGYDPADDLAALEGMWRETLAATGLYE